MRLDKAKPQNSLNSKNAGNRALRVDIRLERAENMQFFMFVKHLILYKTFIKNKSNINLY